MKLLDNIMRIYSHLEFPNQYSPFQFFPEMGGAKTYFLKSWSRKKRSGNKVLGYCLEIRNQYSPFQYVPALQRGAWLKFIS